MFVVLVYDINKKRVGKVLKTCRKYLSHVQKSVFEGNITRKRLDKLKNELEKIIKYDEDSICIYSTEQMSMIYKEQIGVVEDHSSII